MSAPSVADAVADELAAAGVDRVFGLPGGEILFLMDALRRRGVEFTLFRHEADAGLAAAVYGKLKGTAGVVLTTLGPGAANLLLPIGNSLLDREPLVAISAQVPADWEPAFTHQRLPLANVFRPVTKSTDVLQPFNCRSAVRDGLRRATAEPQGPVYLTLSAEDAVAVCREAPLTPDPARGGALAGAGEVANELRRRLAQAERPLVLVGIGARTAHAAVIRRWISEWGLPVAVTPKVKGLIDETSPTFVGVITGMAIDSLMVEAVRRADLLIGLGLDPVEIDKRWHIELPVTWVLESAWATNLLPKDHLAANIGDALTALMTLGAPRSWPGGFDDIIGKRRSYLVGASEQNPIGPLGIVAALSEALPPQTIVTTDVGSHKYLFGQFWPSREPNTFFMSNGLSGMGYGLPAAIAAKLAHPERPVLAVMGDGGFAMNGHELETARRLGAALIVLVIADGSYSLIRLSQENKRLPNYGVDFDSIDVVMSAKACGVDGVRATDAGAISAAVAKALRENSSIVIEVPVAAESYKGIV
jgi:acetolactate synthase-1/2/3 large subunit